MLSILRFDYDASIQKALKHKRKISQLQSLKNDLSLYFTEEETERIARETMKELHPIPKEPEHISVQSIVDKARREHKRKVSQFASIKADISKYFDDAEAGQLAAEMMKEIIPNDRRNKRGKVTIDSIVDRAMTNHQRKKSQYESIKEDLQLIFAKEDVDCIVKNVMKRVLSDTGSKGARKRTLLAAQEKIGSQKETIERMKKIIRKCKEQMKEMYEEIRVKDAIILQNRNMIAEMEVGKKGLMVEQDESKEEHTGIEMRGMPMKKKLIVDKNVVNSNNKVLFTDESLVCTGNSVDEERNEEEGIESWFFV